MVTFLQKYVALLVVGFLGALCLSCSTAQPPIARHTISTTVVYADSETINLTARRRGYYGASVVRGFYDPVRNELWCPSGEAPEALRTCGHELRHVIIGQFHR